MPPGKGKTFTPTPSVLPDFRPQSLQILIAKREVSPVEVTDHFLNRIEEHDHKIKSFAYVDHAGARAQAQRAEQAVASGEEHFTSRPFVPKVALA